MYQDTTGLVVQMIVFIHKYDFLIVALIVILFLIYEKRRVNKIRHSMHKINVALGGPFIPILHRDLTDQENEMIKKRRMSKEETNTITMVLIGVSAIVFILSIGLHFQIQIMMICIIDLVVIFYFQRKNQNNIYADLRSPVFKLVGPINWGTFASPATSQGREIVFYVGGKVFVTNQRTNPRILPALYALNDGDLIEIEYTPFTKTILDISQFNGKD